MLLPANAAKVIDLIPLQVVLKALKKSRNQSQNYLKVNKPNLNLAKQVNWDNPLCDLWLFLQCYNRA